MDEKDTGKHPMEYRKQLMRQFVMGDIHGAHKALLQCLHLADFNIEIDRLYCLGDVCDRGPQVFESIETLLTIKNLVFVLGNHDFWTLEWAKTGKIDEIWYMQGGSDTLKSYPRGFPVEHRKFLEGASYYHLDENGLFVHGGIDPGRPLEKQDPGEFIWNRDLARIALSRSNTNPCPSITGYQSVYIGHTPTINSGSTEPFQACEVWFMDTGAGWGGPLSMMDLDKKEVYQSDRISEIYP